MIVISAILATEVNPNWLYRYLRYHLLNLIDIGDVLRFFSGSLNLPETQRNSGNCNHQHTFHGVSTVRFHVNRAATGLQSGPGCRLGCPGPGRRPGKEVRPWAVGLGVS